jgi:hypothetical protein
LDRKINFDIVKMSFVASLVMTQIAISLYFWPVTVVVGSLFLTVTGYVILGLGQIRLEGRLFSQTIREHLYLSAAVFVGMFLATRWGV